LPEENFGTRGIAWKGERVEKQPEGEGPRNYFLGGEFLGPLEKKG